MLSRSLRSTRAATLRTAARAGAVTVQHRCYQGGLTDKDRIFTNLYNDTSPYLEGAKKRVGGTPLCGMRGAPHAARVAARV